MNDQVKGILRNNWYLFAAIAVLVGASVVLALRPSSTEESLGGQLAADAVVAELEPGLPEPGPFKPGGDNKSKLLGYISGYKADLVKEPDSDEAKQNIRRIGNLYYSGLNDYAESINYYELLMEKYPDWEGTHEIYPNLAQAYNLTGQLDMERIVYERMLKAFPSDSQYYLLAQQKLGRQP
ncbi:MAG: hypothetical protein AAB353_12750 [Candidatus Hydrogenedentota bacterium]